MEHALVGKYDILLHVLSFTVILLTSLTVFDISTRIRLGSKLKAFVWLIIGSFTLGMGLWGQHFIDKLSFMPGGAIDYSILILIISFSTSVVSSFIFLYIVTRKSFNKSHNFWGTLIMGSSILFMHYFGIKASNINSSIHYSSYNVILSAVLAFLPSFIFMWISYKARNRDTFIPIKTKLLSGLLIGLSITVMHYTESFSAVIIPSPLTTGSHLQSVNSGHLAIVIGLGIIFILAIVLVSSILDDKFTNQSNAIKTNEQYYKSLFEENSEAILLFDLEGHFLHINQSVNELFGYSIEELLDKPFTPLVVPEFLKETTHHFNQAVKGSNTTYNTSVIHKQGFHMDLNVKNIPIVVDNKIVSVFAILKDITEIKKSEEALIEAESKYRSLVEQSLVGVYIYQDSKIVYANPRLVEIMGYSEEEFSELQLSDYVFEEDIPIVTKNIQKRLKSDISSRYEYRAIKKSGEMVHLEIHGSQIRYRGEAAVIGTVIDISDRKKAEETVQYMAFHDSLTGLPNRNFLNKRLNELMLASKTNKTAILLVELKSFKNISDSLGQEFGNSLILETNDRIKTILNNGDFISRWHEDKLVILRANTNLEMTTSIAQEILNVLYKPMGIFEVYVNPTIGISMYPDDGGSTDNLLNKANSALYYAKQNGNNSYLFLRLT